MESPHAQANSEARISPKGTTFDRDSLLDLLRSIVRHPAVKDAAVEMIATGLSEPAAEHLRDGVRAGANEALARLSEGLRSEVTDALDAVSEEDWTLIAREMLEDAKGQAEAAAVA